MKTFKNLILVTILLGSLSAKADCLWAYADAHTNGIFQSLGLMLIPPAGIAMSVRTYQVKKMEKLIKEAKENRVGSVTKGLLKSIKRELSAKAVHKMVRKQNKFGKLCKKISNPRDYNTSVAVTTYRSFKNDLRYSIDFKRVRNGEKPIWNDTEDL